MAVFNTIIIGSICQNKYFEIIAKNKRSYPETEIICPKEGFEVIRFELARFDCTDKLDKLLSRKVFLRY